MNRMARTVSIAIAATLIGGSLALTVAAGGPASTAPPDSSALESGVSAVPLSSDVADSSSTTMTTIDPVVAEQAAVSEAAQQARAAFIAVLVSPDDADAAAALDEYYVADSAARHFVDQTLQDLADAGLRIELNPTTPDALTVEIVTFLDGPPPTQADLTVCTVKSAITHDTGPAPETSDVVVNHEIVATRSTYRMIKADDTWKLDTITNIESWDGATTCPPPPDPTTTTLDPIAAEQAAVAAAVVEIHAVGWNAVMNIDAPGNIEALDAHYTENGVARGANEQAQDYLRSNGYRVRDNPDHPRSITVESVEFVDGPPATSADAIVCFLDSAVVFEPGAAPDGGDAIVNDLITTSRQRWQVVMEDGTWQLEQVDTLESWRGALTCPPA